jgi:hypothetical protein
MNEMGFDGKNLGKNGQRIQKPIQICIRPINNDLGYEGHTRNGDINFVKEGTSTKD